MLGSGPICPECKHKISLNTTRCPACKKTIPKKYTEKYTKGENIFWVVFLIGFLIFLAFPLLFIDSLGSKRAITIIAAGIPISLLVGYFVKRSVINSKP